MQAPSNTQIKLNEGIINAIARVARSQVMFIENRLFVLIPKQLHGHGHIGEFEEWVEVMHLSLMHAVSFNEGPFIGYIEAFIKRPPDHYGLITDGKLPKEYRHFDTYGELVRTIQGHMAITSTGIITGIAIWR
jgi:hypothetical protein